MEFQTKNFNPVDFSWRGLTLTASAAAHIRNLVRKQSDVLGIRLQVKESGCAGFCYVLDTVREPEKDDLLFEEDGVKLYVSLQAMPFVEGTEIDYVQDGLNQLLRFKNPKAKNKCGCGESFGI